MTSPSSPLAAVEDAYFASNPPPKALGEHARLASAFVAFHARHPGRRVVLITSGGTTVPLERQTVRFIDNFSAGTRGATSAEFFLEAGYAVVFLHRQFSLLPYSRHFSHSRDCFLDFLTEGPPAAAGAAAGAADGCGGASSCASSGGGGGGGGGGDGGGDGTGAGPGRIQWRDEDDDDAASKVRHVLRKYRRAKDANMLLMIPFVTIGDYLHELRALSRLMGPLGRRGLLYLAAAVSDFFVPPERMAEHKIQSTDAATAAAGPPAAEDEEFDNFDASPRVARSRRLVVDLDPVPKFLKNLVDGWAPQGMIVSYKLETDPAILVRKARYSLDRYQHHLVIGNLLSTRKWEVVFVSPGREDHWLRVSPPASSSSSSSSPPHWGRDADHRPLRPDELPREDPETEIESLIIPAVAKLHDEHIARGAS
ncbi:hypothetical protein E4U41_002972 [Claviceps citrina]|nr:hypothetical protein E4U41_002972 [Claviceps citrina]